MWHYVVSELLGRGTVSLVSCWDVVLCRWRAIGMWHYVVGELLGCGSVVGELLGCGTMSLVSC
jgi:hypothetical protein